MKPLNLRGKGSASVASLMCLTVGACTSEKAAGSGGQVMTATGATPGTGGAAGAQITAHYQAMTAKTATGSCGNTCSFERDLEKARRQFSIATAVGLGPV